MEMEFMAEFTEGMSCDRARQIIKGKRTKRQRPCSPVDTSTTSGYNTADGDCFIDNQSPVMSSEMSTEEDEEMANCLILLAQSDSPVKEVKSDQIRKKTEKLSSPRFTETDVSTAGGKIGFYAYECKTCNRTFPSFQALGGHRASHKKPKVNVEEKKTNSANIPPPLTEYSEEDHDQQKTVLEENFMNVQYAARSFVRTGIINSKGKFHECSICGSEFSSGQALGGHMRKHRPIPPSINRTGSTINTDDSTADQIMEKSPGTGSSSMLSLDLNFPPPEVADDVQSTFQFTGGSSKQHLVFSAPALVDCHY
ncbi:hypothetical protein L1987_81876 [Smallanthus sonchifolius]|uniref:Uncharacterized protein n=1 Tax=Smallanthus sonchifolius TaxID=185202 RepID=A0ACB8YSA7_9ASTR|nr:hypothetical protein L1987_81876 [Smallanthus sonchifolius]